MSAVPVFLCGEARRGDDAVAFRAAALLPASARAAATLLAVGRLDVQHLLDVPSGRPCVVVDAVVGIEPGTVFVVPLGRLASFFGARARNGLAAPPRSSHAVPVEEAVALATLMLDEAPAGMFVGLGGASFALGTDLSGAVERALPAFAAAIAAEIHRLAAPANVAKAHP